MTSLILVFFPPKYYTERLSLGHFSKKYSTICCQIRIIKRSKLHLYLIESIISLSWNPSSMKCDELSIIRWFWIDCVSVQLHMSFNSHYKAAFLSSFWYMYLDLWHQQQLSKKDVIIFWYIHTVSHMMIATPTM